MATQLGLSEQEARRRFGANFRQLTEQRQGVRGFFPIPKLSEKELFTGFGRPNFPNLTDPISVRPDDLTSTLSFGSGGLDPRQRDLIEQNIIPLTLDERVDKRVRETNASGMAGSNLRVDFLREEEATALKKQRLDLIRKNIPQDQEEDIRSREAAQLAALEEQIGAEFGLLEKQTKKRFEARQGLRTQQQGIQGGSGSGLARSTTAEAGDALRLEALSNALSTIALKKQQALSSGRLDIVEEARKDLNRVWDRNQQFENNQWSRVMDLVREERLQGTEERLQGTQERIISEQARDNARSITTLVLKSFGGVDISSLPEDIINSFSDLEQAGGLASGFIANSLQVAGLQGQVKAQEQLRSDELAQLRLNVSNFNANLAGAKAATGITELVSPTGERFTIDPRHKAINPTSAISSVMFEEAKAELAQSVDPISGFADVEIYRKWMRAYRSVDDIRGVDSFLIDFPLTQLDLQSDEDAIALARSLFQTGQIKEDEVTTSDLIE